MMKNYFETCKTLEDVKQLYKKLARELHPDCNPGKDTTKDFQEMNNQYTAAFNRLKNVHVNKDGETYTKETEETPEQFKDIIDQLLRCEGLVVELCGSWLWVTGNTKDNKDTLKALNFGWSKNKSAWYFHFEPFKKRNKKSVDLETIRNMYGSQQFKTYTGKAPEIETA